MSRSTSAAATPPTTRQNPSVSPYKSPGELVELRSKFYSNSRTQWTEALAKVKVLQLRGKLPHGVECTALFKSAVMADENNGDPYLVRSSYAMALVRFVNGVLDPFQQGQYASALVNIAKAVGLPLSFVEIRHAATHEELPSLEALRALAQKASKWLYDNFWCELPTGSEVGGWTQVRQVNQPDLRSQVVMWLKIYKRMRKKSLDTGLGRRPDENGQPISDDERTYWSAIDSLVACSTKNGDQYLVVETLVRENFLIKRAVEAKIKTAVKIYLPLLELCGPNFRFALVLGLIQQCSPFTVDTFEEKSAAQAEQWLQHLLPLALSGPFPLTLPHQKISDHGEAVKVLRSSLSLLETANPVLLQVEKMLVPNDHVAEIPARKKFTLPPLLEDILCELVSIEEKEPIVEEITTSKRQRTSSIFELHQTWEVLPFGVARR